MKVPLAIATLAVTGVIAAASIADEIEGPGERHGMWARSMLTDIDADQDGTITRAEIEAREAAVATEIDADKNGVITVEELVAYQEKMRAQRMAQLLKAMDSNGDGTVSVEEYQAAQSWRLARLDRNGDGQIEPDEMEFHGSRHHHH
jgi:Ca2+-binding EF-hand superfamily protein